MKELHLQRRASGGDLTWQLVKGDQVTVDEVIAAPAAYLLERAYHMGRADFQKEGRKFLTQALEVTEQRWEKRHDSPHAFSYACGCEAVMALVQGRPMKQLDPIGTPMPEDEPRSLWELMKPFLIICGLSFVLGLAVGVLA